MEKTYGELLGKDLETFKKTVKEFTEALPSLENLDQIENGYKGVALGYLNLQGSKSDIAMGEVYLSFAAKRKHEAELKLIVADINKENY